MHKLYIVNPAAYHGKGLSKWKLLTSNYSELLTEATVIFTQKPGDAYTLTKLHAKQYELVIAVGGDGTVSEVLTALFDSFTTDRTFGIIPLGTGNDGARNLGITNQKMAVKAIRQLKIEEIDVIKASFTSNHETKTRYGLTVANAGFGATVFAMNHPWIKRFLGRKVAYYLSTLIPLLGYNPPLMSIEYRNTRYHDKCWMCITANNEWAGAGGMRVAPDAAYNDGYLHLTIVPNLSLLKLLQKLSKLKNGAHYGDPELIFDKIKEIQVFSKPEAQVEMDGDFLGFTPLKIHIIPKAINMIVY